MKISFVKFNNKMTACTAPITSGHFLRVFYKNKKPPCISTGGSFFNYLCFLYFAYLGTYLVLICFRLIHFAYLHLHLSSLNKNPDDALLSHGESPHYHRRHCVLLLSSVWSQVGPQHSCRRENSFLSSVSVNYAINFTLIYFFSIFVLSSQYKNKPKNI